MSQLDPSSQQDKVTSSSLGNVLNLINNVYYCGPCCMQIETEHIFENHVFNHKFVGLYQCFHCPALGPDTNSINEHMAQQHPTKEKYYGYLAFPKPSEVIDALKRIARRSGPSERRDAAKSSSAQATTAHMISSKNAEISTAVSEKQPSVPTYVGSNVERQCLKPMSKISEIANVVENIKTILTDTQEDKKGKTDEQTPSTETILENKGTEESPKLKANVKPQTNDIIELSDDDSDIEITGESRIPVPKPAGSQLPESMKLNNSYETKLQCAFTNGQYVCKSCNLGSKYLSQFASHVYSHLHNMKDGVHGCPYCPQDIDKSVAPIKCKLVVQLLGILEKQKTAQELCKQGFTGSTGMSNAHGGNAEPITQPTASGNMQPALINNSTPVSEASTVSPSSSSNKLDSIAAGSTSLLLGNVHLSKLSQGAQQAPDDCDKQNVDISPIVIAPIIIEPEELVEIPVTEINIPESHPSLQTGVVAPNREDTSTNNGGNHGAESHTISQSLSTNIDTVPTGRISSEGNLERDGSPKPTVKVQDQKSGGRSIVRCYHNEDQFVCERCKYSVHHSKPKVFRKHLWFEVHPMRDCNHCPESSQYNQFKCCPIINQLMLYLLDAKAKKQKKLTEEAQKEKPEVLPSEKQVDDYEEGANKSGLAVNVEEPSLLSELAGTQNKVGNLDHSTQLSSSLVPTSSQGLPLSSTEPKSSGLSESTTKPNEISPALPLSSINIGNSTNAEIDKQLESSTTDVIKMIQGLNNDTAPGGDDQKSHPMTAAELTLHTASVVSERVETEESGQSSHIPNSNIADDQNVGEEMDCIVLPSSSTDGSKECDQNESAVDVISLSSEAEANDSDSQGTPDAAIESDRQDLCITNVAGAAQSSRNNISSANEVSAKHNNMRTVGITRVDNDIVTPGSKDNQNASGSLPERLDVSIGNKVVDGNKSSSKERSSTDLINEASNPPDDISKTPDVDNNDALSFCITDVTSQTGTDEIVREQSNEAPKEKDSTKISGKDSSMESKQGDAPENDALGKRRDSVQKTSTDVNEDVDVQTVQKEDIENPNSSKRNLSHHKRGLPSEKDGKDGLTVKRVARTPKLSGGISKKVDKALSSDSSEKAPTGNAYTCSFFKCSLWVTQDAGSFKIHNLLHHPNVTSLPCAFCSETFANVEALITHTNRTHIESKLLVVHRSYHCGFKDCWIACEKALDFLNHNQKVHANSKSFPCCYCKQGFRTLAELVLHIDESVTYSCTVCPNVQKSTYTDIRKHVINSPHGSKQFLATGEVDSEIKLNLKCLLSNETGVMKYKSIDRYVHVEKPVQEGSPQKKFKCTKCPLVSSNEASFEAHIIKCAKKVQQKDKISLLRSARPMVFKKNIKDSEAKSTEKTGPSSSSNDKDKDQTQKTSSGNADVQNIDSERVDRRKTQISQCKSDGDKVKLIDVDTAAASSSKTTKSKKRKLNRVQLQESSDDSKAAKVINKYKDNVTKTSKPKKRKRESTQELSHQVKRKKHEDNLSNLSHPIADEKELSPVHVSEDEDDNNLPDVEPPSSPDLPPSLVAHSPVVTKGVLQSLGKGQSVSCEQCSFETEFRVVKTIHERVHLHKQDKLKLLWCPHCVYSTNKLLHFKIHVQCHTEKTKIRLYNCGHCLLSSNKMDLIDDHHEEVHADLELKSEVTRLVLEDLQCFECTATLKTEVEFLEHVEQHHSKASVEKYLKDMYNIASLKIIDDEHEHGQSKTKGKINPSVHEADFNAKISEYAKLELNRFQCPHCEYSCHRYHPWARHIVRNHKSLTQEYIVFSCGLCKWKSTDKTKLIGHCKMTHDEITVVEQRLKLAQINVAIETEEEEKQKEPEVDTSCLHHCDFCSFSTSRKAELVEHWATHEGQTLSSTLSSDEEDAIDTSIGGKTTENIGTSNKNLEESEYSNYNKDTLRLINDMILNLKHDKAVLRRTGSCPLCPFTSKFRNDMVKHLNFHKKTAYIKDGFQCGYCLYISEFEAILTKHVKKDHPTLPMKKKVIGDARLKCINERVTGDEPLYSSDQGSSLKGENPDKDTVQDNRSEDSGITSPTDVMEDERMSTADAAENSLTGSTDIEDMSVNTKLRFSTRNVKQENEGRSNVTADNVSLSSLEDYFIQDGKKLEYTEDILRLLDDMILNIQHSERGNYSGTLICPICPYTSPDKCALRMHLQSHKSQASITDGYRCSYCLYTSEKLFPITRHQSQLHPRLPKKKIRIGNPGKTKTAPQNMNLITDAHHQDELGFNSDLPGFTISAVVGSDGSTAMVNMNTPQNDLKPVEENQGENTGIQMGVSLEMEEYCRSLYCIQDVGMNTFRCKKCPFLDDDPEKIYSHFCMRHQEDCPFQCGYCEYRSVAVVKIGQHCEISHNGLPVKVSPVIAGSKSEIAMETKTPATHDYDHGIGGQSDGLSTYMIDCGDDVHMCSICGYEHNGRQGLKKHLLTSHLNDYPYKCQHCDFAATESNQVQKHTDKCHSDRDQTIIRRNSPGPSVHSSEGRFRVPNVAVKEEPQPSTSSGQLFNAGESNQAKSGRNDKRQHYNYEHRFRCELCAYSTKWQLMDVKVHVLRRHLNLRPNNCRYCSFGSRLKTVLGAHYRSNHRGMPGDPSKDWDAVQEALAIREEGSAVYVGISECANLVMMTYKPNISKRSKSSRDLKRVEVIKAGPDPPPVGSSTHTSSAQEWQQRSQSRSYIPCDLSIKTSEDGVTVSGSMVIEPSTLAFTSVPGPRPIVIQPSEPAKTYVLHECNACNSRYAEKEEAQYHVMVHHLNMDPYMCSGCRFGSRVEREVIDHSGLEHPGEQIAVLPAYKEHMVVQEYLAPVPVTAQAYQKAVGKPDNQPNKTSRLIPCSMCRDKLPNSKALIDHMAAEHVDYTGFTCCYCATFIKAKPQMRTHFQSKHPNHKIQYKKVKDGIAYGKTLDSFPTATWMRNKNQNIGFANLAKRKFTAIRSYSLKEKKYGMPNQKKTSEASGGDGKMRPRSKFSQMRKQFAATGSTVELHCKHCNYITTSPPLIKDHVKRHLGYKPFKCGHCQMASSKNRIVVAHSRRMHKDLSVIVNKVVDPAVLASLTNHFRVEVKQGKQNISKKSMNNPAASHGIPNSRQSISPNSRPAEQHPRKKNTVVYGTDSQLDETRQGELFICVLCGEEKDNRSNLLQHIMLELNYRPWSCPHCEFRDVTLLDVKNHCFKSHPELLFKVVIQKDAERMAKIQALVERSRVSVDEEDIQDASQGNVVDAGRNMGLPFNSSAVPVKEEKFKPFKCSYCNITACNLSELSEHMVQDHPGMRPLNVFPLDEHHQPPMMQQEHGYPSASQATTSSNRVSLEPSVDPQAQGGVIAQPELNSVFQDSNQGRAEKFHRPTSGSKKTLTGSQGHSPKPRTQNPDGYIGVFDGVTVTGANLELKRSGVYYCRKCPYFASRDSAVGHYVRCHTAQRWKCPHCDFRSTVTAHVRRHCRKNHPDLPVDVVLVETPDTLTDVSRLPEAGVPEQQEADFSSSSDMSEDVGYEPSYASQFTIPNLEDSPAEESSERPRKIGKFDGVAVTDKHLVKDMNGDYSCRECTYSANRASAVGHYVRCHMPMRWKCPYCDVKCTITHEVRRHCKKMHPGLPVHVVLVDTNNIEEPNTTVATARPAKRSSTSSKPGPACSKKQKPNLTNVPSVFCCYLCTFKTDNTLKLIEHQKEHAERTLKLFPKGDPAVPSGSAMNRSPSPNSEEAKDDQSGITCLHCFYVAKSVEDLEEHNREKHVFLRPFKCGYCDFSAFSKGKVRGHSRNIHKDMPESVLDQKEFEMVDTPRIVPQPLGEAGQRKKHQL